MRARYYNTDIRRFINQDIITGSIGNSQSLNRYAYVQGNPVSYTDPFGLSPLNAMADAVGHAVLDLIGSIPVFGAPANILNCYWYCKEGNREMAVMSGIAILPGVGQFIGAGAKALKLTRTSQYIITATKFAGSMANCMIAVGTCIETGKRIYHDIRNGKFGLNVNTVANIATIGLSVFAAAVSGKEMAGAGVELANMVAEDLHEFGVKVDTLLSRLRLNDKGFTYLYRAKNNGNGIETSYGKSSSISGADNIADAARLKEYYRQAEKYGTGSIKELENGRFRFYGKLKPARTKGEMAGLRQVREWDPYSGLKRDWFETVDHNGNIRQVRPDPNITGGVKVHYMFDSEGNYIGKWSPE